MKKKSFFPYCYCIHYAVHMTKKAFFLILLRAVRRDHEKKSLFALRLLRRDHDKKYRLFYFNATVTTP